MSQPMFQKYLTPEVHATLKGLKTKNGVTIDDVVRSGIENPDSSIGVYAGDEESYDLFAQVLGRIVEEYHGHGSDKVHVSDMNLDAISGLEDLDPEGKHIVSTRIRVGRNLKGFPLMPGISKEGLVEVERRVLNALSTLDGDLEGTYYPLRGMSKDVRLKLVEDHFLFEGGREPFKEGDRFLESGGVTRNWPIGRGIFHSDAKTFLVWVNEEDQLRIISMQQGGDVAAVFGRLVRAVASLENILTFAFSKNLGYITSCPTNLGTAMRASVHVKLPNLSSKEEVFKKVCEDLSLSIRGVHGEHTESEGGVFDISNKRRLGISEVEIVSSLHEGVRRLLKLEAQHA